MNSDEDSIKINSILNNILNNYLDDKLKPFSSEHQVYKDFDNIIEPLESMARSINPNIKVKKSIGMGNWATIPWISFLDNRETGTTQDGMYVVILFRADMSGFYICLSHGVTKPKEKFGKKGAYDFFRKLKNKFLKDYEGEIADIREEENKKLKMDLKSDVTLAKDYEAGTLIHSFIDKNLTQEQNLKLIHLIKEYLLKYKQYIDDKLSSSEEDIKNQQVWVISPGRNAEHWNEFYKDNIVGIGFDEAGDLSKFDTPAELSESLKKIYDYGVNTNDLVYEPKEPKNITKVCYDFVNNIKIGDLIFVKKGRRKLIGAGIVSSNYKYITDRTHSKNIRGVDWLVKGEWDIEMIAMQTLVNITNYPETVEKYKTLLGLSKATIQIQEELYDIKRMSEETNFSQAQISKWLAQLERKKHIVFQGPPGTGKTFVAEKLAKVLKGKGGGLIETVQFHPSYSYEDFIEGIRPELSDNQVTYNLKPGRFLEFCDDSKNTEDASVLIIDEINRANLSRVFGELMYLLEYRDKEIPLSGGSMFKIPDNVYLIGTMNTADRSIALVDHALRRRFTFIHLAPQYEILEKRLTEDKLPSKGLVDVLKNINNQINDKNYEIGISYFMKYDENLKVFLPDIWEGEIEPYLEEFFFDQQDQVDAFRWEKLKEHQLKEWVD